MTKAEDPLTNQNTANGPFGGAARSRVISAAGEAVSPAVSFHFIKLSHFFRLDARRCPEALIAWPARRVILSARHLTDPCPCANELTRDGTVFTSIKNRLQ